MNDRSSKTALEQQQDFAKLYGNSQGSIVWDLYHSDDKRALFDKVKMLYPNIKGDARHILENRSLTEHEANKEAMEFYENIAKGNEKLELFRQTIIDAIWNQRKYNEKSLLASIIFVILTESCENLSSAKYKTKYSVHPLFRIRKCRKNNNSNNCCMIFVDEFGRVYQNWNDFISNNKLPEGVVVAPRKGVYSFNYMDEVDLICVPTPSSSVKDKIVKVGDHTATGLGITAAVTLPIVAFVPPLAIVAAPIMLGCAAVGAMVGGWTIGRASADLADRGHHEQSIGLHDREARSSWFSIVAGAVGIGAMGATQALTSVATAGKTIPLALQGTVFGLNGLSLAANGVVIGNGVAELIMKARDGDKVTSMDILELSTSLLLFTHSIYNLHMATKLINSSKEQSFSYFRKLIGAQQNVDVNQIMRHAGEVGSSKIDIIRCLNMIPYNQLSKSIVDIMEKINAGNVLPPGNSHQSFNSSRNCDDDEPFIAPSTSRLDTDKIFYIIDIIKDLQRMFYVGNVGSLTDVILNISESLSERAFLHVIEMGQKFAKEILMSIFDDSKILLPFENFLFDLFKLIMKTYGGYGKITRDLLNTNARNILAMLKEVYNKLFKPQPNGRYSCSTCGGYYTITQ